MKQLLRKLIPNPILGWYHRSLAAVGAAVYGHPSRSMVVIGVTGTKGKTTTAYLIAKSLEAAGYPVGLTSTVLFKVGQREWRNELKQTMPGRFRLQRLLADMVKAGCRYAVVETSSEGIAQHRHRGIDYDVAVFTNLSPEHIEAHGSYERYRAAKLQLFSGLAASYRKKIAGQLVPKVIVANSDDREVEAFLVCPADTKYTFSLQPAPGGTVHTVVAAERVAAGERGSTFTVNGTHFSLQLLGQFNVYNALAAVAVGLSQGVPLEKIQSVLGSIRGLPGRMEEIENAKGFRVFVDYAHEPASLEAVYQTITSFHPKKIISVLGSQGGGRDKAKRPILGRLAAEYANHVIVTNEDPYDEDPQTIIDEVAAGAQAVGRGVVEKILDRGQALRRAIELAQAGDIVIVSGKGGETKMAVQDGKLVDWSDSKIIGELVGGERT